MNTKTVIRFRPKESPAPIYTPIENDLWYDNLLDSNRVMEILGKNQIQGTKSPESSQ